MNRIYRIPKIYTHLIFPVSLFAVSALSFLAVSKWFVSFKLRNIIFPVFLSMVVFHLIKTAFMIELGDERIIFSTLSGKKEMKMDDLKIDENGIFSLKVKDSDKSVFILQLTENFSELIGILRKSAKSKAQES